MPDEKHIIKKRDTTMITAATVAATGKRFCQDHQGLADATNGGVIKRNKASRWVCAPCQEKRAAALAHRG